MPGRPSPFPEEALAKTVVEQPIVSEVGPISNTLVFYFASSADTMIPWGTQIKARDIQLRKFYPTENMLSSAVGAVAMRNAAFEWKIEAPPNTKESLELLLRSAISGSQIGWIPFITKLSLDLETQDNGAFMELIRRENKPTSPVVGIGNLDAGRCIRTGNIEYPVIYYDLEEVPHKLAWYQVIAMSDLPSPIEKLNGLGMCAVSRTLRMAQILLDLAVYKQEKVSGRFTRAIHVVGGVSRKDIDDITKVDEENADNRGLTRFIMPFILTSLDPEKPVSHVEIPMASLPDGFDMDAELKWYIATLALGFGVDYQDFAPLPGGNLGTSTQSEILHRKSRGKGPALFMNMIRDVFKWYGVIPRNADFLFREQDIGADKERAELAEIRARERALRIKSAEITPEVARIIAMRTDDLEQEDIDYMMAHAEPVKPERSLSDGQDGGTNPREDVKHDGYLSTDDNG